MSCCTGKVSLAHTVSQVAELEELKTTRANNAAGLKAKEKQVQVWPIFPACYEMLHDKYCVQDMQGRVQQLRNKAESARSKASEAKASQAAEGTRNLVLSSLTRLRQQGRISGFHVSASACLLHLVLMQLRAGSPW